MGLTPRPHQSGSSVNKPEKVCKLESGMLRKTLYFPAMSALQHNPVVRAMADRLRGAGKQPMVVIVAAMCKLLHLAYGVLKSGKPFDPAWAAAGS